MSVSLYIQVEVEKCPAKSPPVKAEILVQHISRFAITRELGQVGEGHFFFLRAGRHLHVTRCIPIPQALARTY